MKKRSLLLLAALGIMSATAGWAQFGSFGDIPIEISADGETRFSGGVAIAENNVSIHYGSISLYSDYAQYNPETRDVLVSGNVRIYRDGVLFTGDRALYNLETKSLRTADFEGGSYPFTFQGQSLSSMEGGAYAIHDAGFTTSDSSKPDYRIRAKTLRIYPGDYVVFSNASLLIGETPVFWFPYYYQSLNRDEGFSFVPGYDSRWGAYLLTQYGIPISRDFGGKVKLDLRSKRGVGLGFDIAGRYGYDNQSWMRLQTYYAHDTETSENPTALAQEAVSADRYRVTFESQTFFTEDIYAIARVSKLSDSRFLRDFYPNEYRIDPQPDNVVALTKRSENYTLSAVTRFQVNDFFGSTERLPEIALDIKRQPFFGISWLFYEGETTGGVLRRTYPEVGNLTTSTLNQTLWEQNYRATRWDTFHQFLVPHTFADWLTVTPRVGYRGTYYSRGATGVYDDTAEALDAQGLSLRDNARTYYQRMTNDSVFRNTFNAGIESSFKLSREWESAQNRNWGLDGLRHIVQPYTNLSYVATDRDPYSVLQFDRLNPSTQLPPIDFPQFTTIDTISNWTIWRFGVRNRLQTRRDNRTINWLEMDSFFDVNIQNPQFPGFAGNSGTFSNVYNKLSFYPLPWVTFDLDSQLPILDDGFIQIDSSLNMLLSRDLRVTVGHRYLDGNPYFYDSSLFRVGAYYRINDNWGVSFREQFEFSDSVLERQEYAIHRDLSSWVASLGFQVRDNRRANTPTSNKINSSVQNNVTDYSVILTFTLKDLPQATLPVSFDPSSSSD